MKPVITKSLVRVVILCAIGAALFYRTMALQWSATVINRDNTLSDRIAMSSVPFLVGGFILGIGFVCSRWKNSPSAKLAPALGRLLGVIASVLLVVSILWDISLAGLINGTLTAGFPETLQEGSVSHVFILLSGILLFGLSFLLVGVPWMRGSHDRRDPETSHQEI